MWVHPRTRRDGQGADGSSPPRPHAVVCPSEGRSVDGSTADGRLAGPCEGAAPLQSRHSPTGEQVRSSSLRVSRRLCCLSRKVIEHISTVSYIAKNMFGGVRVPLGTRLGERNRFAGKPLSARPPRRRETRRSLDENLQTSTKSALQLQEQCRRRVSQGVRRKARERCRLFAASQALCGGFSACRGRLRRQPVLPVAGPAHGCIDRSAIVVVASLGPWIRFVNPAMDGEPWPGDTEIYNNLLEMEIDMRTE